MSICLCISAAKTVTSFEPSITNVGLKCTNSVDSLHLEPAQPVQDPSQRMDLVGRRMAKPASGQRSEIAVLVLDPADRQLTTVDKDGMSLLFCLLSSSARKNGCLNI